MNINRNTFQNTHGKLVSRLLGANTGPSHYPAQAGISAAQSACARVRAHGGDWEFRQDSRGYVVSADGVEHVSQRPLEALAYAIDASPARAAAIAS